MELRPRQRRVLRLIEVLMAGELLALALLHLFAWNRLDGSVGAWLAFSLLFLAPAVVPVAGIAFAEMALAGRSPERSRWTAVSLFMITVPLCLAYLLLWAAVAAVPWNVS